MVLLAATHQLLQAFPQALLVLIHGEARVFWSLQQSAREMCFTVQLFWSMDHIHHTSFSQRMAQRLRMPSPGLHTSYWSISVQGTSNPMLRSMISELKRNDTGSLIMNTSFASGVSFLMRSAANRRHIGATCYAILFGAHSIRCPETVSACISTGLSAPMPRTA